MRKLIAIAALAGGLLVPATANAAIASGGHVCGASQGGLGVMAGPRTSCQFARATIRLADRAYARTDRYPRTVRPYSQALGRRITMSGSGCGCAWNKPYVFRGGNNAAVWLAS